MSRAQPLSLAHKLKNIVDICEAADAAIDEQNLIKKGALDAGKENDGIEPGVVRKILARRKRIAKDPAETTRLEDLMTDYQFMLGEGREDARPWTQTDDEIFRVMALTNTSKPPKIEAIKKALGCSQGKAHKLRSIVAVRLAKKSSSSSTPREHEHLNDGENGEASQDASPATSTAATAAESTPLPNPEREARSGTNSIEAGAPNPVRDGEASADERDASASSSPPESCGGGENRRPAAPVGSREASDRKAWSGEPGGPSLGTMSQITEPEVASGPQDIDLTLPPFLDRRVAA